MYILGFMECLADRQKLGLNSSSNSAM